MRACGSHLSLDIKKKEKEGRSKRGPNSLDPHRRRSRPLIAHVERGGGINVWSSDLNRGAFDFLASPRAA